MSRENKPKNSLQLLHSDRLLLEILNESNKYLEKNEIITNKINSANWVLFYLNNLIPQTVENLWSGHIFPIAEAKYELECSIDFCKLGFYKHAISSLRNVLELGLLSVYWDVEDNSHIQIKKWFKSTEQTPFKRIVFTKLKVLSNVKKFDDYLKIFERTANVYEKLSNFGHTKGFLYSSRKLNKHYSNVNNFNEKSFLKWFIYMVNVVEIIIIFHILKYPVGLQNTPIEKKFGINGPMGGLLQPFERDAIKKFLSKNVLKELQKISNNDPDAIAIAKWVNDRPNIRKAELSAQIEKDDKCWIEMEGFEGWVKNQKKWYKPLAKSNPDSYRDKLKYFKKLKVWAKENGCLSKEKTLN